MSVQTMLEAVSENLKPLKSTAVLLRPHTSQLTAYQIQLFERKSKVAFDKYPNKQTNKKDETI